MEISNYVLMFAFIMTTLLIVPVIFERLRLPGVVGLIVAGIVIGPHALGILKSEEPFRLFSSVGLIYIMFLAGLEINIGEFKRQKKNSIIFGSLTFLLPMIIGTLGAKYLFPFAWPTAILLASMFASHTLIPMPITSRLGINKERAVVTAVGGTIITDTAALLVLAIIAERATANLTAGFWFRQSFLLIALIWFALWALPRLAYLFFKMLAPDGKSEFLLTLSLVFITSYLSHRAGVEPIIGAFFAGLSLSRLISEQSPLKNRLEFVGNTFFIPFFLISVGMLVNLRAMFFEWRAWPISAFMIIIVVLCKYLAALIFSRLKKFNSDECNLIFGLSINQAAATLAAVIVGFRLGIFDENILNGTIFMILITCLIGPWVTEKYGQNIARRLSRGIVRKYGGDKKIMVALSHSESAEFLTDVALSLRAKDSKAAIYPLYVVQDGFEIERRTFLGEKVLGGVVNRIVAADIPVFPVSRVDINIPEGIIGAVKEHHSDVLVLGSASTRQLNLKAILFDVADKVCDESHQLLFLCQVRRPLNIGENIFLLIPPLLEDRSGFPDALEAIKNLALNNKLKICLVSTEETIGHIKNNFFAENSTLDITFFALEQWKGFPFYLKKAGLKEADSIILMSERKGRLGWNPSLKRLFHALGAEFPVNNVMTVYLPDRQDEQTDYELAPAEEIPGLIDSLAAPAVYLKEELLEKAVLQLLESQDFGNANILAEAKKNLFPLEPIELSSGIVLFHAHSQHIKESVILLGLSRQGFVLASLKDRIKAFFILVSPKYETNIHLRALTQVAKIAKGLEIEKTKFF